MIILNGKYGDCKIFSTEIDNESTKQIISILNHPIAENAHIRIMPDVHVGEGCVIGFTSKLTDKIIPNLIGVDIGCIDKDTEVLTPKGWIKISNYMDEKVLVYDKERDEAEFQYPITYIERPCNEFYHFKNSKGLDQVVSRDHRMLVFKGYKQKGYKCEDMLPEELLTKKLDRGYYNFKASFNLNNKSINFTDDEIRLDVMICADGCIRYETDDKYKIELHFRKKRKIHRAKMLLNRLNIKYKETKVKDQSTYLYFFVDKKFNKTMSKYWKANKDQLKVLYEECLLWDGHNGYRSHFLSINKQFADIIQFAFTSNNIRAGVTCIPQRQKKWRAIYIVTPTKNSYVSYIGQIKKVKPVDGKKYCFVTKTGYFVARRGGKIFITGNCGVLSVKLENFEVPFDELDDFIHKSIPLSTKVRESHLPVTSEISTKLKEVCKKTNQDIDYVLCSLGTLGGGNHFLEVEKGKYYYLTVHSGSRNFGLKVAKYHQNIAKERLKIDKQEYIRRKIENIKKKYKGKDIEYNIKKLTKDTKIQTGQEYLTGEYAEEYIEHMKLAQQFALLNRRLILKSIIKQFNLKPIEEILSIHNYIDFNDKIIRKGAISAREGEVVIIPLNMKDGIVIGIGKGNQEWNFSAPHGTGRLLPRNKAKEIISLDDFSRQMDGIWSTSINKSTIDESPQAYKNPQNIINLLKDTISIIDIAKVKYVIKGE